MTLKCVLKFLLVLHQAIVNEIGRSLPGLTNHFAKFWRIPINFWGIELWNRNKVLKGNASHVGINPGSNEILQPNKVLEPHKKQEMRTIRCGSLGNCGFALGFGRKASTVCWVSFAVCGQREEWRFAIYYFWASRKTQQGFFLFFWGFLVWFFFLDSFGTRIKLYKAIGPGKHPAAMCRGFIICLESTQPTGDRVSFSEWLNLYPDSCLACDKACEVPVRLWDGQSVGWGSPEPTGLARITRSTLAWQAVTEWDFVAWEMLWVFFPFLLLGVSKSTECQLPVCLHCLLISPHSFFVISPSCTHLDAFESLSASS